MVTAILPSMTIPRAVPEAQIASRPLSSQANGANITPSISSEVTITPARYQSSEDLPEDSRAQRPSTEASTSQLAGLVGMFTGLGALLALVIFLPLPGRFENGGATPGDAVADSFYVVGAVAFLVAIGCFFGLRNLPGEEQKGWKALLGRRSQDNKNSASIGELDGETPGAVTSYFKLLSTSIVLGFQDMNIGLGYVGGFVARASSVAISLFIPLFVNAYFINSGICPADPDAPGVPKFPPTPGSKESCRRAYIVAAKLTGTSQLVALLCAPVFGYLSGRYRRYNLPLILAAFAGIAGYAAFGSLKTPDPAGKDGSVGVYFIAALLGISQIGAIVCSLGLLGRGIQSDKVEKEAANVTFSSSSRHLAPTQASDDLHNTRRPVNPNGTPITNRRDSLGRNAVVTSALAHDTSPLLPSHIRRIEVNPTSTRAPLKGSIAGVYSLTGGAGILLLTKVGGVLFDRADVGSPFWLMAGFNAMLFVATVSCGVKEWTKYKWEQRFEAWAREEAEGNGDVLDRRSAYDAEGDG